MDKHSVQGIIEYSKSFKLCLHIIFSSNFDALDAEKNSSFIENFLKFIITNLLCGYQKTYFIFGRNILLIIRVIYIGNNIFIADPQLVWCKTFDLPIFNYM